MADLAYLAPAPSNNPPPIADADARALDMLRRRQAGHGLDAIGRHYGVSGERARQIIGAMEAQLVAYGESILPDWRALIVEILGSSAAVPHTAFVKLAPPVSPAVAETLCRTLVKAAGGHHPHTWAGALRNLWSREPLLLDEALRAFAAEAPYAAGDLEARALALGVPVGVPIIALARHPKSPLVVEPSGVWVRRGARGRDAAYLWLAERGEPQRAELIAAALTKGERAVSGFLRRDPRFRQIRPEGTWVLREWPLDDVSNHTNTADVVLEVLTEMGPMPKAALFSEVSRRYPVSTARIQQCLISDRVGMTEDDLIDLVERGAAPIEEREPRRPEGIVVDPSGKVVGVRISVNRDLLRGSGVIVHHWLTWYLGMRRAPMSRVFVIEGSGEELTVRRSTSGAQISSLRRHAASMGLVMGCRMVILLRLASNSAALMHACGPLECPADEAHTPARPRSGEKK